MEKTSPNQFLFQGEVIEIIHAEDSFKCKILCREKNMIIETDGEERIKLGDTVTLTGTVEVDNMRKKQNIANN